MTAPLFLFECVFVTLFAALCELLWSVFLVVLRYFLNLQKKLQILIFNKYNDFIMSRSNLFETRRQWF